MSKISDVTNQAIKDLIGNMCLTKITLAATGAAATVASTGTFTFTNGGAIYTHAALAAQSITATHAMNGKLAVTASRALPTGKTAYFTLGVNASGKVCVSQGDYAGEDLSQFFMGTTAVGTGAIPDVPAGYTPIGVIKIVNTSVGNFIAGTTLLDVAGITDTYTDVCVLPVSLA